MPTRITHTAATTPLLRRFFELFRPYWHLSLYALFAIFAIDLCDVASPKVLELLIVSQQCWRQT